MFLFKRGIWLLIVEIFIMNFAFSFDIHYSLIALQTIWSIAISMIILGLVIWLPFTAILITGSLIVLGHNALDFYEAGLKSRPGLFYSLLHVPGPHPLWDGHTLLVLYPFLAWSGLMMMGYCLGRLFLSVEGQQRKKMLIRLGLCIIIFFIALRYSNKYGNPFTWHTQKNLLFTFLDFMNVQKYPPSLLFMCATIGPALIFLAFTENIKNGLTRFIMVYGRVPFFYYILHFYLIHLISSLLYLSRGHSIAEGIHTNTTGFFQPNFLAPGEGYSLAAVYGLWLFVVLSLYPLCKWFSRYKQTHSYWWLSYL